MLYGKYSTPAGAAITPGRSLINCNPNQFKRFLDGADYPTSGQLLAVLPRFELQVKVTSQGLVGVFDKDDVAVSALKRHQREALRAWWDQAGLRLVKEKREETKEWMDARGPGRPGSDKEAPSERTAKRTSQYQKCYSVFLEAVAVIEEAAPTTAPWTKFLTSRDLLRHQLVRPVGERRATVEALVGYYDLYDFWPAIGNGIDHGEFDYLVAEGQIPTWLTRLGEEHNAPYMLALQTLNLALTQTANPRLMLQRLGGVLKYNEIASRPELRRLAEAALL